MAKTPAELCIEYAEFVAHVRRLTGVLRKTKCSEASGGDDITPPESSCLDEFFSAPKGPDGEFPRDQEFFDEMCEHCKTKLRAIDERRHWKIKLGAVKRNIERVGKKLSSKK
jgi:hypothetical protein